MTAHRRRRGLNWPFIIISAVVLALVALLTIGENYPETGLYSWGGLYAATLRDEPAPAEPELAAGSAAVHFLDTGQSDCILIVTGDKSVLIDAGERGMGTKIVNYIREQGVKKLDLVIATHPHSDHIGSMSYVIDHLEVAELLLPDIPQALTPASSGYEALLASAEAEGCKVTAAAPGQSYRLAEGAELTVLAPIGEYEELNDWSVVTRLTVGARSFLFTGDAGEEAERDILASGAPLSADLLKVGHHGSASSCSAEFLDAVSPRYAVILVGSGNDYGHPADSVVSELTGRGCEVFRTDLDGSVTALTDGETIGFTTGG